MKRTIKSTRPCYAMPGSLSAKSVRAVRVVVLGWAIKGIGGSYAHPGAYYWGGTRYLWPTRAEAEAVKSARKLWLATVVRVVRRSRGGAR